MTFILGMAGGTASGKSTLAQAVRDALGPRVLHINHDRYYKSLPLAYRNNPVAYNFDHPDALDTARLIDNLADLKSGRPTELPIYEFPKHARSPHTERVHPTEIVLVEGILALAEPALCALYDHAVYVDTPADIRLMRRVRRDSQKRGRTPLQVLDQYEATVRPMHEQFVAPSAQRAQQVVSGTAPIPQLVQSVLAALQAHGV